MVIGVVVDDVVVAVYAVNGFNDCCCPLLVYRDGNYRMGRKIDCNGVRKGGFKKILGVYIV